MAESHKILAQNAAEDKESTADQRKEFAWLAKETVKQGLENAALTNKAQKGDGFWSGGVNIFSKAAVRYLFYILGALMIAYFVNLILHLYAGWPMVFPGGELTGTPTPPGTGEPVTGMP